MLEELVSMPELDSTACTRLGELLSELESESTASVDDVEPRFARVEDFSPRPTVSVMLGVVGESIKVLVSSFRLLVVCTCQSESSWEGSVSSSSVSLVSWL